MKTTQKQRCTGVTTLKNKQQKDGNVIVALKNENNANNQIIHEIAVSNIQASKLEENMQRSNQTAALQPKIQRKNGKSVRKQGNSNTAALKMKMSNREP